MSGRLPHGVELRELTPHADDRGVFTELYREEWGVGADPIQWNAVRSKAGVLRGVHVHPVHDDYLTVPIGRVLFGLCDLRPDSPTYRLSTTVEIAEDSQKSLMIPHGVAHGFYFVEDSIHVYAVSHYWNLADELGCRWDDPALGIEWSDPSPQISQRDADLQTLSELIEELAAHYDSRLSDSN
ncbi:MAG: dTDP-4-dehydrorhamnose 3,5-epimerase [Solirubrobacterales bacterium]